LGYVLIALGILVIFYSVVSVYSVFSSKSRPVELFKLAGISLDMSGMFEGSLSPEQQRSLKDSGASFKSEIVAPEVLNQPLNFSFHLLLMGFIASAGYKLASLGVMLVRPIKVKLKLEEEEQGKQV